MTLRKSSRQKVAPLKSSEAVVNYGGRFGSFVQWNSWWKKFIVVFFMVSTIF